MTELTQVINTPIGTTSLDRRSTTPHVSTFISWSTWRISAVIITLLSKVDNTEQLTSK